MADGINLKMRMSGDEKVRRDMKKTGKSARTMGKGIGAASSKMNKMAAAINPVAAGLAAAAAGFVAAALAAKVTKDAFIGTIRATVNLADELDGITKKAQSIGATNTDLQLVSNAMALFGVETSATIKATQKFNQALGLAMLPDAPKTLTKAFDRLGISAEDLIKLPLKERFIAVAQGFQGYANQATRAADASLLFGRMGKDALVAFSQGGQAMRDAVADVERYGVASDLAFFNSENLIDAQFRLELAFKGLKANALEPIMPALQGTAQALADIVASLDDEGVRQFGLTFSSMVKRMVVGVASVMPGITALSAAIMAVVWSETKLLRSLGGGFLDFAGGEVPNVEKQWDSWAKTIIDSIESAEEAAAIFAAGPMFGPDPPPVTPPSTGGGGSGGTSSAGGGSAAASMKKQAQAQLKALELSLMSEEERFAQSHKNRRDELFNSYEQNLISLDRYLSLDNQLQLQHYAKLDEMRQRDVDNANAANQQKIDKANQLAAEQAAIDEKYRQDQQAAAFAVLGATASFASSISEMITATMGEESEEAKKAAKVMFGIQQAVALADAGMSMAMAIGKANAAAPYPLNVPAIIAASVTGAAQIAAITAATISGVADAGLPPGALKSAGLNQHTVLAVRNDEMVLEPVGTAAISRMLEQRATGQGQPIMVNASVELDGEVLGRSVDNHLVRSSERGLGYERRIRY